MLTVEVGREQRSYLARQVVADHDYVYDIAHGLHEAREVIGPEQ